jgi:Calx-beta domain
VFGRRLPTTRGVLAIRAPPPVPEPDGQATILVERQVDDFGAVSVDHSTSDATAHAGSDSTASSGTLSWAQGDAAPKSFTVPIVKDTDDSEGEEDVHINLSNPTGGALLGQPQQATMSIRDASFWFYPSFEQDPLTVAEESGQATLRVRRKGG